jgi:ankyrin repeat protein
MLCYMQWLGPPLGDESVLIPRAFFQWNSAWSIPVASGSMEYGYLAIVRCLARDSGADVNQAANNGVMPLHIASKNGHLAVMRLLVEELGADVNQVMHNGDTSLYIAAQAGHLEIVLCLAKEFGAVVNQATSDGHTPLCVAAGNGHLAVVRLLVKDLAADVNQAANDGATPLYFGAQENHLDLVRCLVKELGANVNQAMHKGYTPLMVAAEYEYKDVLEFLIKYGARPQISSPTCGTAADLSKSIGAPAEQTAYLEARTHCANPGCSGAGVKKCAGCLKVYYCVRECQLAHRSAHKKECRQSAEIAANKKK